MWQTYSTQTDSKKTDIDWRPVHRSVTYNSRLYLYSTHWVDICSLLLVMTKKLSCHREAARHVFRGWLIDHTIHPTPQMYMHSATLAHVSCNMARNSPSRSSKVIDLGTSWKPVCDFQLVFSSNLRPILHCFGDTAR